MKKRVTYFVKNTGGFVFNKILKKDAFSFHCEGPFGQFYSGNKYLDNFRTLTNDKLLFLHKQSFKSFLVNFKNSLNGVSYGFFVFLKLKGVGFRSWIDYVSNSLVLVIGLSHYILYKIPEDILIKSKKSKILIFGIDKHRVFHVASEIYSLRVPDVYKGKGIQYANKNLVLKVGKQR
jgi:hypothetical protein